MEYEHVLTLLAESVTVYTALVTPTGKLEPLDTEFEVVVDEQSLIVGGGMVTRVVH